MSAERLQLALEASGDGLWDWNITTGNLYISPRWATMLGFQPEELADNAIVWELLVHPEDKPWVMERLQAHFQDPTVPYRFDYRVQRKTGEYCWIANYGKVVTRDLQGKPLRMIGLHRDITNRKQGEKELRRSAAHLKIAQRIGQLGSWEFDLRTEQVVWSEEVFRICGLNLEVDAPSFEEFQLQIHPDDRDHYRQALQTAIQASQPYDIDYRIYRPDGTLRHIQSRGEPIVGKTGQPIQLVGTIQDISDRKQVKEELRRSASQLKIAQRLGQLGSMEFNLRTEQVTWSEEMFSIFGLNPEADTPNFEEFIQKIHPDDRYHYLQVVQTATQTSQPYGHLEK